MHQSSRSPRDFSHSQTFTVPSTDGPSSSLVTSSASEPRASACAAANSSAATTMAAIELFMSAAPRPCSRPSRCVGTNGALRQAASGPVGTTSVWPAKTSRPASASLPGRTAHRLVTGAPAGPKTSVSQTKPCGRSRSAISAWQPASSGVSDGRAISASASRSAAPSQGDASAGQAATAAGRTGSAMHVESDLGEAGHLVLGRQPGHRRHRRRGRGVVVEPP